MSELQGERMNCLAHKENRKTGGFNVCFLLKGHRSPNHLDTYHNVSWPVTSNTERESTA